MTDVVEISWSMKYSNDLGYLLYPNSTDKNVSWFAINPYTIPIPRGTALLEFQVHNRFPYCVKHVGFQLDPNQIYKTKNSIFCLVYSIPVKNTIPLFIYKKDERVYVNFKREPLEENSIELDVSPVFVMDKPYSKFECIEGICVPSDEGKELGECVKECVKTLKIRDVFQLDSGIQTQEFVDMLKTDLSTIEQTKEKESNLLKHVYTISVIISVIVFIIVVIY